MDHSLEVGNTCLVTNPEILAERLGHETLLVVGAARGMTSFVSFTLYQLDYFIGNKLQERNYEDIEFLQVLQKKGMNREAVLSDVSLKELIQRRNEEHTRWGFKLPRAVRFLPELVPMLRKPIVVLCVRNPIAVTRSIMIRNPSIEGGVKRAFDSTKIWMPAMHWLLESETTPSIIIDMDKASRNPGAFLNEFTTRLGFEGDTADIEAQLRKSGYKSSKPREGIEFVAAGEGF